LTATPPTPSSGVSLPSSATYDPNTSLPLTAVDPNSQTVTYKSYDPLFRPTEIDYPDGGVMIASYTPTQTGVYHYMNASTHTNTQSNLESYGRLNWVAVQNASGGYYWNNYCYGGNGDLQFVSYRFTSGTIVCSGAGGDFYTYDTLGRVLTITHGDNSTVNYVYNGRATQVTDENGVSRIVQVDGLGRPTAVCEISSATLAGIAPVNCGLDRAGTGFLTTYAYSTDTTAGNALKTVVTQGAQTRTFETDWLGRTTSVIQPEAGTTTYSYAYNTTAGYGLTVTRVRPQANQTGSTTTTTTTQYDSLGRVLSVNYSDNLTPNKQFVYDVNSYWTPTATNLKGRLAVMGAGADLASHHTGDLFSYDVMGRVVGIWACAPATCGTGYQTARPLSFAYDWVGNLTQESDNASGTISFGRSIAGEVTSITNETYTDLPYNPPNLVSNVVNGPDGPVSYTLGNGLNVYRSYDTLGRLYGQWVCNGPASATCSGGTQIYGTLGQWKGSQLQYFSDTLLNQQGAYGYDGFNRLTSRTVGTGTVQNYTYSYDRYGNRVTQTPLQTGYTFDPTVNAANNQITTSGFTYDAAGNMTDDTVHSYTYDAEGNILQVDGGNTAVYVYDALNRRVHVQTASATNEFVYDYAGRRISTWLSPNNDGSEGRIYWDGQQTAYRSADGTTYFDHQDTLGTERLRTNYGGSVGSSYISLPWGDGYTATVNSSGADQDNEHFAGLEQDAESGTEHAQFRNYASAQGRWLAPDLYVGSYDLANPQSANRYAYALNNPLAFIDPTGLFTLPPSNPDPCDYVSCNGPSGPSGGGGGGGGGRAPAPSNGGTLKRLFCGAASALGLTSMPGMLNSTVGVGVGGSAGIGVYGGVSIGGGIMAVADQQGNVGIAINLQGNPGQGVWGVGAIGGGQVMRSNATTIGDLQGLGPDVGGSIGAGDLAVGFDFAGSGSTWAGTETIGVGLGPVAHGAGANISKTWLPVSLNCN
jgi:RHS repeat-associated protein